MNHGVWIEKLSYEILNMFALDFRWLPICILRDWPLTLFTLFLIAPSCHSGLCKILEFRLFAAIL